MKASPAPGPDARKRKAPRACILAGRLSTISMSGFYHLFRGLQWPIGAVFWLVDGWLAGLDAELLRRNQGGHHV
jgi:hypothetical protein